MAAGVANLTKAHEFSVVLLTQGDDASPVPVLTDPAESVNGRVTAYVGEGDGVGKVPTEGDRVATGVLRSISVTEITHSGRCHPLSVPGW